MHEQNLAILKGLVSVAWADGRVAAEEMSVIEGLLQAYEATPSEAHEVRLFARQPRTLEDVPLTDLSAADRRMLLHQAVIVTFADGEQSDKEREVLSALITQLRIPAAEATTILESGAKHAQSMLHLLGHS
jgi:tellurite resistance protein